MNKLFRLLAVFTALLAAAPPSSAQCPLAELIAGLQIPLGITQSNQNNLLVSETGTGPPNTGRISIVDLAGNRRTLLDGLPSAINDVNEPAGPAGLFMRGRTLYVAIGVGDVGRAGPLPGTTVPNPDPISSPIFSSVLAIHFSAAVEKTTTGFTLTPADQQALAGGQKVTLSNAPDDQLTVEVVADFPDFTPNPLPFFPDNIRLSNPFDLVLVADRAYVTDGGQNMVRRVDLPTGAFSTLAAFPNVPNPLFPALGPPTVEAVPTGVRYSDGQLLVTLFRGFPFPPGTSQVQAVDPATGDQTPFITGLKTAIDVIAVGEGNDPVYLVLQHASGPIFGQPGLLLGFATPAGPSVVLANCLARPTSMVLDEATGTVYVTELIGGRILRMPLVD